MEKYTIRNLNFTYPEQIEPVLQEINLSIEKGEFVILCGPSGCGKSTFLRQLKPVIAPHGKRNGEILFDDIPVEELDTRRQASAIGFVSQSPDNQIVTDKVWHELAFGLESLGMDTASIRRRVAEMASFFGIQEWFHRNVTALSGGQKQLLHLASVMVMQPSVIILDEPTSQLDPIAASDFLAMLGKINRELGITVILTEHRLEEAMPFASRIVVMDKGKILCAGTAQQVGADLKRDKHSMFMAMPAAMRIWAELENDMPCPVTVQEGSKFLSQFAEKHTLFPIQKDEKAFSGKTVLQAEEVWFRYEKNGADIIKGLTLCLHEGEFFAMLGGNGTGKTTSLKVLAGLHKHYRGEIQRKGKIGLLTQNPQSLFVRKTVYEDLEEVFQDKHIPEKQKTDRILKIIHLCRLDKLLDRHPYDLSGGEQQRAALAKLLLCEPEILLLDEPTKGLDTEFKQIFAEILTDLLNTGKSVLMVSHDIAFCAEYADTCALFFDGEITAQGTPHAFFSGNSFYTTAANRMARHLLPEAVTVNDVVSACGGKITPYPERKKIESLNLENNIEPAVRDTENLPLWRKILASVSGVIAVLIFIYSASVTDLSEIITADGLTELSGKQIFLYAVLLVSLLIMACASGRRAQLPVIQVPEENRKLTKRTCLAAMMILLTVPLTLFISVYYLDSRKYNLVALIVLLECMLPFFLIFEGRKPKARELVVIAVLCAIGVAGRAAFFMLPQFKPVMAITIIAGVAFGGETGFLVGAVTMLASNILFSQGPWTPWQMFSMGLTGFLAGILFRKGLLRRTKISLCIYGALAAIVIYGGIMNPASAIIWSSESLNRTILIAYYLSGFPMDCIHALATAFFLYLAAEPMLEKLDRIKIKYGLTES